MLIFQVESVEFGWDDLLVLGYLVLPSVREAVQRIKLAPEAACWQYYHVADIKLVSRCNNTRLPLEDQLFHPSVPRIGTRTANTPQA